jgi:NAD(P)-dependent dehydrogenase (short-subunit alcohol dehydrogenase family)
MWDVPGPFEFTKTFHKKPYAAINPTRPELSAAGKIILVTGGGTGIGRAIIEGFSQAGAAQIITIGRRKEVLEKTIGELQKSYPGTKFHGFPASVSNSQDIISLFATIRSTIGEPDILVTCAADQPGSWKVLEIPPERLVEVFQTNVFGNLTVVREFLKGVTPESKTEKIILEVSSSAVHRCYRGSSAYTSSKTAFGRLIQHVQGDYWDTGLRVHRFHPGTIASEITLKGGLTDAKWDNVNLPGQFAVWLASPEAEFLKGRFLWAHWDVNELLEKKEEIQNNKQLATLGLVIS